MLMCFSWSTGGWFKPNSAVASKVGLDAHEQYLGHFLVVLGLCSVPGDNRSAGTTGGRCSMLGNSCQVTQEGVYSFNGGHIQSILAISFC